MNANELAISVEHVTKRYQLGVIGRGTLRADLQSKIALWRGVFSSSPLGRILFMITEDL